MAEKTSVRELFSAMDGIIKQYAINLKMVANGEKPTVDIDESLMNKVVKLIEKVPFLEAFEKASKGISNASILQVIDKDTPNPDEVTTIKESHSEGNAFEIRSKKIQAKLNGSKA